MVALSTVVVLLNLSCGVVALGVSDYCPLRRICALLDIMLIDALLPMWECNPMESEEMFCACFVMLVWFLHCSC
eukprot:4841153-Amphidinium_carterae.7